MFLVNQIHFFNKLRRHIGIRNAINAYINLRIIKSGILKLSFLKHPLKMRIGNRADMETFNEVLLRKTYDIDLDFKPKTIIDAGANIGMTSAFYASKYPQAKIISVEPNDGNFSLLEENTKHYEHISCLQAAIWHKKSTLQLIDIGRGDNSFIVNKDGDGQQVDAITISNIMSDYELKQIDLLKIDIEGAEKEVFGSGHEQWLPKTKVVIVEIHDKVNSGASKAVFEAFEPYNFTYIVRGVNQVFYNNDLH